MFTYDKEIYYFLLEEYHSTETINFNNIYLILNTDYFEIHTIETLIKFISSNNYSIIYEKKTFFIQTIGFRSFKTLHFILNCFARSIGLMPSLLA